MSTPLDTLFRATVNHLLHAAPWARQRLQAFAQEGSVECRVGDVLSVRFGIDSDGYLVSVPEHPTRQVTLSLPVSTAAKAVFDRTEFSRSGMSVHGDAEFAEAIGFVFQNLSWDAEEDLARILGDQGGYRVASAFRTLADVHRNLLQRAQEGIAEFLTEEKPVLVHQNRLALQQHKARELRDSLARLEKRVQRMENRLRDTPGR